MNKHAFIISFTLSLIITSMYSNLAFGSPKKIYVVNNNKQLFERIWNSEPIEVGREFISKICNILGYCNVFNAWSAPIFLSDKNWNKFQITLNENISRDNYFFKGNLYALAFFMLAAALKVKNKVIIKEKEYDGELIIVDNRSCIT